MLVSVGQLGLGLSRRVQRPEYACWEGALPVGLLPYTRHGDIMGIGEGMCCPLVQHPDRKRSPSLAPFSEVHSHSEKKIGAKAG